MTGKKSKLVTHDELATAYNNRVRSAKILLLLYMLCHYLSFTRRMDDDEWEFFQEFRNGYHQRFWFPFTSWRAITVVLFYFGNVLFVGFLAYLLFAFRT